MARLDFMPNKPPRNTLKHFWCIIRLNFPKRTISTNCSTWSRKRPIRCRNRSAARARLNVYGVETRYPADLPELTLTQARTAVDLAAEVQDAVGKALMLDRTRKREHETGDADQRRATGGMPYRDR